MICFILKAHLVAHQAGNFGAQLPGDKFTHRYSRNPPGLGHADHPMLGKSGIV
jgi:hypothetical protein